MTPQAAIFYQLLVVDSRAYSYKMMLLGLECPGTGLFRTTKSGVPVTSLWKNATH